MPTTAEQLARKNREGLTLLLKLLAKLGMPHKEIAKQLGVSQPLVSAWAHSKRYMTAEDQDWCYTTFVNALLQYWPEDDEQEQRKLYPLMETLVETWREANRLEEALDDAALNALIDAYRSLRDQPILSVEDCYRVETAQSNFQALAQAQYENRLTRQAWETAERVLADAKKILGPAPAATRPQPTRPRPSRHPRQRKVSRRLRMHA
jgi:Predicted transcriptional regulator